MDVRALDPTRTRERRSLLGPNFWNRRRFLVLFWLLGVVPMFNQILFHNIYAPYYTTQKLPKGNSSGLGYIIYLKYFELCVFSLLDDIGDLTFHRFDSNPWTPTSKPRTEDIPTEICQTSHQVLQTLLHPGEWTLPARGWWWGSDIVSNLSFTSRTNREWPMVRCSAYGIIYVFERLKEPGAWRIAPGLAKFHSSPMMKVAKTLQTQIVWLHCLNMFEYFV